MKDTKEIREPEVASFKSVNVEVLFNEVKITLVCDDDYQAQVVYDDIEDRFKKGGCIIISRNI